MCQISNLVQSNARLFYALLLSLVPYVVMSVRALHWRAIDVRHNRCSNPPAIISWRYWRAYILHLTVHLLRWDKSNRIPTSMPLCQSPALMTSPRTCHVHPYAAKLTAFEKAFSAVFINTWPMNALHRLSKNDRFVSLWSGMARYEKLLSSFTLELPSVHTTSLANLSCKWAGLSLAAHPWRYSLPQVTRLLKCSSVLATCGKHPHKRPLWPYVNITYAGFEATTEEC